MASAPSQGASIGGAPAASQNFSVNLLSEEGFEPTPCMCEVGASEGASVWLCGSFSLSRGLISPTHPQIGLEGLSLKQSGRVVRSYPLESIIRWSVREADVFCFWVRSKDDKAMQVGGWTDGRARVRGRGSRGKVGGGGGGGGG